MFCLEDIHWADPSSIELLRAILSGSRHPALVLCLYRPPFALFPGHLHGAMGDSYREIRLQETVRSSSGVAIVIGAVLEWIHGCTGRAERPACRRVVATGRVSSIATIVLLGR